MPVPTSLKAEPPSETHSPGCESDRRPVGCVVCSDTSRSTLQPLLFVHLSVLVVKQYFKLHEIHWDQLDKTESVHSLESFSVLNEPDLPLLALPQLPRPCLYQALLVTISSANDSVDLKLPFSANKCLRDLLGSLCEIIL